jgi:hypothetical protein
MGTGISKRFPGTKGSGSTVNLGIDLFSDKATGHMDKVRSLATQKGNSGGHNLDLNSEINKQNKEMPNDENGSIFQLFVAMCYLLKSKLTENKNEKLLELLNAFDTDSSLTSFWFSKFKKFFKDKSLDPDYGCAIVNNFINRNFSDPSGLSVTVQRNEWIALVQNIRI